MEGSELVDFVYNQSLYNPLQPKFIHSYVCTFAWDVVLWLDKGAHMFSVTLLLEVSTKYPIFASQNTKWYSVQEVAFHLSEIRRCFWFSCFLLIGKINCRFWGEILLQMQCARFSFSNRVMAKKLAVENYHHSGFFFAVQISRNPTRMLYT